MAQSTVLITGISGYLGLHVARVALDRGYKVRGTIRNPSKELVVRKALGNPGDSLSFAVCDLTGDEGWEEAFKDVDALAHVASPFILKEPKDEQEYLRPAVEGTLRVMRFASQFEIENIVVTATYLTMAGHMSTGIFGPNSYTPLDAPNINSYIRSKVAAEEALWNFVSHEAPDLSVSTIHPGAILGPPLTTDTSGTSVSTIRDMLTGAVPGIPPISVPMVDVRDAALAHIAVLEKTLTANKRYIVSHSEPISYLEVSKILRADGYSKVPSREIPVALIKALAIFNSEMKSMKAFLGKAVHADISETVSDLNWNPRPIKETVLETAKAI